MLKTNIIVISNEETLFILCRKNSSNKDQLEITYWFTALSELTPEIIRNNIVTTIKTDIDSFLEETNDSSIKHTLNIDDNSLNKELLSQVGLLEVELDRKEGILVI